MAENMEIHHDLQWHKWHHLLPEKKKCSVSCKELLEMTQETLLEYLMGNRRPVVTRTMQITELKLR